MPRRSWMDLVWPVAGIDRSVSYQSQPPFTTPDALNVRTEDMSEHRERGGSRPGLGLSIRTQLSGPVRWIGKVSVLRVEWPNAYSPIYGNQLSGGLVSVPWSIDPDFLPRSSNQGLGASLSGSNWGLALSNQSQQNANYGSPYTIAIWLRPSPGLVYNGTAKIFVFLDKIDSDPAEDCIECGITFGPTSYSAHLKERFASIELESLAFGPFTDDLGMPGSLVAEITPATRKVELFWRRRLIGEIIKTTISGHHSAFAVSSPDSSIQATKMTTNFSLTTSAGNEFRSQRRELLVAISEGSIYLEDSAETLFLVAPNSVNSTGEMTAVDREQKLYIADYGAALQGTASATVAMPTFNTLSDPSKNFTAFGIDSNYVLELIDSDYIQNEQQSVELFNTDGGSYRLGFRGAFTTPIPQNAQGIGLQLILESLPTIGSGNVIVQGSGGGPHTVTFQGAFAGQDVELLSYQADSLTNSGTGVPGIQVLSARAGADGEYVRGSYSISSVAGNSITFSPAIPVYQGFVQNIGAVTYQVIRAPKIFNPKTSLVTIHSATKGSVPAGCRLVALYRDRIVYAGGDLSPHVWYMSRQGDPTDWDYSAEDSAAAIFSQASVGGQLADPITALIVHSDECLVFGCYNSLWIMRGDPGYGGSLDQLSRKIGIVSAHAWCRTPDDMLVFLSPDGLYVMPAGCAGFPTSLSRERLPAELLAMTPEREVISLEYDTVDRGIHIFATKHDSSMASHWWFDWEAKSYWRVKLNKDHEPFSIHERIAWDDMPTVLIGGRDGYIRSFNRDCESDDQDTPIESFCIFGPFHLDRQGFDEGLVQSMTATLGVESGNVNWEVLVGDSPESCLRNAARESGTWNRPSLNYRNRPRARGVAAAIRVSAGSGLRWFMERLTVAVRSAGQRRVR